MSEKYTVSIVVERRIEGGHGAVTQPVSSHELQTFTSPEEAQLFVDGLREAVGEVVEPDETTLFGNNIRAAQSGEARPYSSCPTISQIPA